MPLAYNNIDVDAATRHGIPVGNTPGVLTATTAEMAVALTFAAARRIGESERFLRGGNYNGWLPTLFLGELLRGKTVGIIGAGRIGAAYARMMIEGLRMNVLYYDLYPNAHLETCVAAFNDYFKISGRAAGIRQAVENLQDLLRKADCVSIHTVLDDSTHHLINAERLEMMKPQAILINTSRGPVIDEAALVDHCRANPDFGPGLTSSSMNRQLTPGLVDLDNVVIVPHIASATRWTREGMATLAACNVTGILSGYPAWNKPDILSFLEEEPPKAAPSIVNAEALDIPLF